MIPRYRKYQEWIFGDWALVGTDFVSFIKVIAYQDERNVYNAGLKWLPYTKESLQRIIGTFDRTIVQHYGRNITVQSQLYTEINPEYSRKLINNWKKKG